MSIMYVSETWENVTYDTSCDAGEFRHYNVIGCKHGYFIQNYGTGILKPNLQFWIQHVAPIRLREMLRESY